MKIEAPCSESFWFGHSEDCQITCVLPQMCNPSNPSKGNCLLCSSRLFGPARTSELCRYFTMPGGCVRGDKCFYAHAEEKLVQTSVVSANTRQAFTTKYVGATKVWKISSHHFDAIPVQFLGTHMRKPSKHNEYLLASAYFFPNLLECKHKLNSQKLFHNGANVRWYVATMIPIAYNDS